MWLRSGIERAARLREGRRRGWFRFSLLTLLTATVSLSLHFSSNFGLFAYESRLAPAFIPSRTEVGGALVIHGGGRLSEEVRTRFIELAGGPHARILIVPTAHSSADTPEVERLLEFWRPQPVESVAIFHTRSREKADDPEFLRPLKEASGVWLSGGKQSAISEAYVGTGVERELKALLARGGVIGGTSAGAAVMSRVMIESGRTKPKMGSGFGFLPDVVLDQHFLKRNRMGRLEEVIREHDGLFGFGIDEATALVLRLRDGQARVLGESYVVAVLPDIQKGITFTRSEFLKPGDEADLAKLKAFTKEAIVSSIDFDSL